MRRRCAGILVHPTSLPGPWRTGTLGSDALRFMDLLVEAGIEVWQLLPVGPVNSSRSPYQSLSAFAGDTALVPPESLLALELITVAEIESARATCSAAMLWPIAVDRLLADADARTRIEAFREREQSWLDDFALFGALREQHGGAPWYAWPQPLRRREQGALALAGETLAPRVRAIVAEQFLFDQAWRQLRHEAHARGIRLFGDLPIYVAHDSADVWSAQELFQLDPDGGLALEAGVPPDFFSSAGQAWGTPVYRWERMAADDFSWWRTRLARQARLFDWLRIDHFRGLEAYWSIRAGEPPATGEWRPGPGAALLRALEHGGHLPLLVAEDLGVITPEVEALRDGFRLPGMRVLQFAFDGDPANPHLPHNHRRNTIVYTGTHDNDTSLGWWLSLDDGTRRQVAAYLGHPPQAMPWPLVRCALASVAYCAVIPWQDLLGLGSAARMNRPGTVAGNWCWRFSWDEVPEGLAARLRSLLRLYGRESAR